ncbi:MAG TPA: hypothetical protein PLK17_09965 [Bacteroidales bacterium]|jgi:DNA-directed RNA polymerase subunit RPC12/RpoP|nr:hypothetical protein [Bacteroidales bacterium]
MKYYSEDKPIKCPACGSPKVVRIMYGMPSYEAFLDSKAGKIILGGCVVSNDDPKWGCIDCKEKIYKKMSVDP